MQMRGSVVGEEEPVPHRTEARDGECVCTSDGGQALGSTWAGGGTVIQERTQHVQGLGTQWFSLFGGKVFNGAGGEKLG